MSYRLPIIKIISDITNIITAVMLNVLSTLETMFFIPKIALHFGRLCKPTTSANDEVVLVVLKPVE